MATKSKGKTRTAKRATGRSQRRGARSGFQKYGLIVGVIGVAIALVAGFAFLDQGSGDSQGQPGGVSLDKSLGEADAPVVVVEYADFQCPYCRQFAEGPERQLKEDYVSTGQVRFVYRHFAFIGDESIWAAQASECANEQGGFWDYHDKLYQEQGAENSGAFSRDNLKRIAADLRLDTAQFNQCLDSNEYRSKVRDEINEAQRLRLGGTPSILVNGRYINNGADYRILQAAIEAALNAE